MREYSKVAPVLWQSARFNSLPSDDGRYLYLYLLTNSHQNSAGCYRLPDGYACSDLRWESKRYLTAREELVAGAMIQYDPDASVVMIERWFKHNPPTSEDHLTGIERLLDHLPSEAICEAARQASMEAWESFCLTKQAKAQRKQKAALDRPYAIAGASGARVETPFLNRQQR
jgi:hypothetical protein